MKNYLAIDIGATSGRHIVESDGVLTEVFRFETGFKRDQNGVLICDVQKLFANVKEGIKIAFSRFPQIQSLAIDTWGVDYVLMRGDEEVLPCVSYRDSRTQKTVPLVHEKMPFEKLYEITGTQFQAFNTIYQLYDDKLSGKLGGVTDFLMLPEYLNYKLTGVKVKEYTQGSTTGLVNAKTREFDGEIINNLGLPAHLFKKLEQAGGVIGKLKDDIASEVGGQLNVVLCASHDTASAFEAVESEPDAVIVSSGTWSLVGVKLPEPVINAAAKKYNFACEGGVGYIRFLKNITGMWINVRLHEEFKKSFDEMTALAKQSSFDGIFDVNDQTFTAPDCMNKAITEYFVSRGQQAPCSDGDFYRAAYRSLAYCYGETVKQIEEATGKPYNKIYIVGGGAKNKFLNDLTAELTGKQVIAMPIEATSLGNLMLQKKADK